MGPGQTFVAVHRDPGEQPANGNEEPEEKEIVPPAFQDLWLWSALLRLLQNSRLRRTHAAEEVDQHRDNEDNPISNLFGLRIEADCEHHPCADG